MSTTILVCCHKPDYYYDGDSFLPIQVGKKCSNVDLNIIGDDTGDNISDKNSNYCELTALYWYWKNCKFPDYVGLNHYRRYFDFSSGNKIGISQLHKTETEMRKHPQVLPNFDEFLKNYDIILPKPLVSQYPLKIQYGVCHISNDLQILKETIIKLYPEYIEAYEKVIEKGNRFSPYNMFITKSNIFQNYAKWLFDILFEVERNIRISGYPDQARVYGYMGERLMNVYVEHNKLKAKYVPIIKIDDNATTSRVKEIVADIFKTCIANCIKFANIHK